MKFIYKNGYGEIKEVELEKVIELNGDKIGYFYGFPLGGGRPKTYRKDRIQSFISGKELLERPDEYPNTVNIIRNRSAGGGATGTASFTWQSKNKISVSFTGFAKADKEALTKQAENNGLYVAKNVGVTLDILCVGGNAGPKKIAHMVERGGLIMTAEELANFYQTGEIPSE